MATEPEAPPNVAPRGVLSDYLQANAFWLMDVGPNTLLSLPMLSPLYGFQSITAPSISISTSEIPEGNALFTKTIIKRASVGNITLQRGAHFSDSEFYRWITATIEGANPSVFHFRVGGLTPRRNFILVQFFNRFPGYSSSEYDSINAAKGAVDKAAIFAAGAALSGEGALGTLVGTGFTTALSALSFAAEDAVLPSIFVARIPARAWLLKGCIPVRYKAGSDFDGASSEISIMEIEMSVDSMSEISLFS